MKAIAAVLAALVSLSLAGCGPAGTASTAFQPLPVDPATQVTVDTLRALPYGPNNVTVVTDVLEAAGVGVYPDDAADGTEPVRLTRWQVGNLATEAANGGGVPGATLSALAGRADGAPPVSYLLAAWVTSYPSPSAGFARALMGEQDWRDAERVVFPRVLLTLFTADALRHAQVASGPATQTRADPVLDAQRSAWLTYRTGQEPAMRAEQGAAVDGQFKVTAVLHREDVKKGQEILDKLVLGSLPAPIAGVVRDLAGTIIHAATDRLRELMFDKRASRLVTVTFHDGPPSTRPVPGPPPGTTAPRGRVPDHCPSAATVGFPKDGGPGDTQVNIFNICFYGGQAVAIVTAPNEDRLTAPPQGSNIRTVDVPGADFAWFDDDCPGCLRLQVVTGDRGMEITVIGVLGMAATVDLARRIIQPA